MKDCDADALLLKLRNMGVQLRLNSDRVMQYKDCEQALTAAQDAHLQAHRMDLTAALIREQAGPEATVERVEDHIPNGMIRPCFGYRFRCVQFTAEEMLKRSVSEFAALLSKRRDVCGDCTIFHAQYELAQSEEERLEREFRQQAKERQAERLCRNYFASQDAAEQEEG